jgi:uncharacterized cupin superfamily protein
MDEMNLLGESWTSEQDHGDYRWRRMRLAGERLGASLYELPPGGRTFPYHYEVGNEELLVVIAGAPTLREPEGERVLRPGDCVLFPQGPEGAHQLINRTAEPVRVLFVSNFAMPRAAFQPDSGKIMVRWSPAEGDSLWFREEDASDYWRGES